MNIGEKLIQEKQVGIEILKKFTKESISIRQKLVAM
jgi:hypothetical protein